jgi:hypothetical protein
MTGTCWRCGDVGPLEGHHPLCRDEKGRYVAKDFVVRVCIPCHRAVTLLLSTYGLERPQRTTPDVVAGRLSLHLAWLALAARDLTFDPVHLGHLAAALELVCHQQRAPGESVAA